MNLKVVIGGVITRLSGSVSLFLEGLILNTNFILIITLSICGLIVYHDWPWYHNWTFVFASLAFFLKDR